MGTVLFEMQLLNIHLLLFSSVCLATSASETQAKKARDPKLFYVSTTTTTSTWFGSTICFASTTTTLGTCGKRKRRAIDLSDFDPDYSPKIEPSALSDEAEDILEDTALVEPSQEDNGRKGRFLVYWMTTTSVSTSSSYTTTLTVASLTCTPSSFAFSLCG